ncbi:MAG: phage portal protein [Patescibacteria group bacterium]|nr:phage portal protein [Patescibacteria group bacterium]
MALKTLLKELHAEVSARLARRVAMQQVTRVLAVAHAQELRNTPGEQWALVRRNQQEEIKRVMAGDFNIVDRRSWSFPTVPASLHRLNTPLLKSVPYSARHFSETPIARRAINLLKNAVLALKWRVQPRPDLDGYTDDQRARIGIVTHCLNHPNSVDSWHTLIEAVTEDIIMGGFGAIEPRLTPDPRRPLKMWAVSGESVRIFADWTEATPDRPHYAQMTGMKGERGMVFFLDDELIYIRDNVRSTSPFGLGKMDVAFLTVNYFIGGMEMAGKAAADQIHKCFPGDTEVLTRNGWVRWDEVADDAEFATRSKEGKLQWQRALGFVRENHSGELIQFGNRLQTITVTPNHRMLGRMVPRGRTVRRGGMRREPVEFMEARDVMALTTHEFKVPATSEWDGELPGALAEVGRRRFAWDDWAAFLGLWFTQGSFCDANKTACAQIVQAKQRGQNRYLKIGRLLHRMGIAVVAKNDRFVFGDADVCTSLRDLGVGELLHVPACVKNAPPLVIKVLIEWMCSDAPMRGAHKRKCVTDHALLAGEMQELFQKIGSSAIVTPRQRAGKTVGYVVEEVPRDEITIAAAGTRDGVRSATRVPFDGMIYCAMVPNGTLYCREKGRPFWSGNTWLWWEPGQSSAHVQTIRRHIQNELEGQAKVSLVAGMAKPDILEINPVQPNDLLLDWQEFQIRVIANAFDISPFALGLEKDVNYSTSNAMAVSDFKNGVVPIARRIEAAITRDVLHKKLGWNDLMFCFEGMDDPDSEVLTTIQQKQYAMNALTANEIRVKMSLPPLPGGWGDITQGQWAILLAEATAKAQAAARQPPPGADGQGDDEGGGYPPSGSFNGARIAGSRYSVADVATMAPLRIRELQSLGKLPATPALRAQMDNLQPGVMETLTEELQQFLKDTEESSTTVGSGQKKLSKKTKKKLKRRFDRSESSAARMDEEGADRYSGWNYEMKKKLGKGGKRSGRGKGRKPPPPPAPVT